MAHLQRSRYRLILAGTIVLLLSFSGACGAADENDNKGELLAAFSADLKTAGDYEVRFSFTSIRNRALNVPVTVHHQNKDTVVMVNQKLETTTGLYPWARSALRWVRPKSLFHTRQRTVTS